MRLIIRKGKNLLAKTMPPGLFTAACEQLTRKRRDELEAALKDLLLALQGVSDTNGFGVCRTCYHCQTKGKGSFHCGLTDEPLTISDVALICREHTVK